MCLPVCYLAIDALYCPMRVGWNMFTYLSPSNSPICHNILVFRVLKWMLFIYSLFRRHRKYLIVWRFLAWGDILCNYFTSCDKRRADSLEHDNEPSDRVQANFLNNWETSQFLKVTLLREIIQSKYVVLPRILFLYIIAILFYELGLNLHRFTDSIIIKHFIRRFKPFLHFIPLLMLV
jgi:hypothetical protein